MGSMCNNCMARVPYATLIATIMCLLGVGVFCFTMYRSATLTNVMLHEVFYIRLNWLEATQMTFTIIGASMAALGFMIFFFGCLATGDTRTKVYRAWSSRVGGRISCAVFMTITYILEIIWLAIFTFLTLTTFIVTVFWNMCSDQIKNPNPCIDLTQFNFFFPNGTTTDIMKICDPKEIKLFCKDYIEKAELMFILATVATVLVILSLMHYLMCLSANYAHIRDHEKFQELQEMQYLQDPNDPDSPQPGMGTLGMHCRSKDRF